MTELRLTIKCDFNVFGQFAVLWSEIKRSVDQDVARAHCKVVIIKHQDGVGVYGNTSDVNAGIQEIDSAI